MGNSSSSERAAWSSGRCRAHGISRLILWSDTRFDLAHRLYTRTGFRRTGERSLPGDVNETREYRFERDV